MLESGKYDFIFKNDTIYDKYKPRINIEIDFYSEWRVKNHYIKNIQL